MYAGILKRAIDFTLALLGIVALSPVLLFLSLLVGCTSRGPVLFRQRRVGRLKREFMILKFRTMYTGAPKDMPTHLLQDPAAFITPVGRFLRRTSLDELPQLFNILAGQMAVVGPRPALWNQYDLIAARDACGANALRPGLTGLAQVSGRDELPVAEKARLDGVYARRVTFLGDVKIFLRTFSRVARADGFREGAEDSARKR